MDENRANAPLKCDPVASGSSARAQESEATPMAALRIGNPQKMVRLLTSRNLTLLSLIANARPGSLTELSQLSGRPKASLTRTIRRFSDLGIVSFRKVSGKGKAPVLACRSVHIEVPLDAPPPGLTCKRKEE
jgi:predicted transcriptional regulator